LGPKIILQTSQMFEIAYTGPPITKNKSAAILTPKWNIDAMREIGVNYVISALEIIAPQKISMQLLHHYSNNTYSIFLYAVLPKSNPKK